MCLFPGKKEETPAQGSTRDQLQIKTRASRDTNQTKCERALPLEEKQGEKYS